MSGSPLKTFTHNLPLAAALVCLLAARAAAEQLPVRAYTSADGLAHDRVSRIVQDSRGFLWFCTIDGLSRFDGYRFTNYSTRDGLPVAYVTDLIETRRGDYWVATEKGVARLPATARTRGTTGAPLFAAYRVGAETQSNIVVDLHEDGAGNIWAATNGGLFRLDGGDPAGAFRRVELNLRARADDVLEVAAVLEARGGDLWLATNQGLVRRTPEGRVVHHPLHPRDSTDFVWALLEDREGRIWAGTQSGLLAFAPAPAPAGDTDESLAAPAAGKGTGRGPATERERTGQSVTDLVPRWYYAGDGLANDIVRALHQSADGRVWVGTAGGLSVFDGRGFRAYTSTDGLGARVDAVAEDRDGNLWVGTQTDGALKVARSGFVSYRAGDGLGHTNIVSIFRDTDGRLVAVGGKWSINWLEGGRFNTVRPNLPRGVLDSSSGRWAVMQDRLGEWWVATNRGLYRFPRVRRLEDLARAAPAAVYTTREGLADDYVSRLFEDSRGDIWISSFNPPVMLTRWERATGKFHRYDARDGLPPTNWANVFAEDASGALWLGLHNGGLARLRAGRFEQLGAESGVPEGLGQGLHFDRRGRLWIATRGTDTGRIDDPSAERPRAAPFAPPGALSSGNLRCFAEDEWGHVYVGTARGVDRVNPETGQIKHFTTADGLAKSEVMTAFRDRDGALWFGTQDGLSRLAPEAERARAAPHVLIAGLRVGGRPHPVAELGETNVSGLVFGAGQNQIDVDFFGLTFSAGESLRYQYKFEGADRDWSAPTDQRTLAATLAPGSYRFLVRAVGADGAASPSPAAVSFRILPPVWQRWWFLALAALALGGGAYALYRYRLAQLLKVERVRTRIATDLHDDIGASLSRMAILSEIVKHQNSMSQPLNPVTAQSASLLTEIADSARGLVDSMSDIVWSIDPRRDDLNSVVQRVRQFVSDVLEAKGVRWHLTVPPDLERLNLDPEQRRHLFLIFKEAVNNIARHADGTRTVWLSLDVEGKHLVGVIRDDGCGFAPPPDGGASANGRSRGGNGLPNMRARAAELGGRLDIQSAPGSGTRLTLRLPLK